MQTFASIRLAAVLCASALWAVAQTSPLPNMPPSTAARILEQATWGPTPQSISELQTKGFDKWFADQMSAPITTYYDEPLLGSDGKNFNNISGIQTAFFQNALANPDQLRQRVAFALSEIWVVSHDGVVNYTAAFPPLLNIYQKDAFAAYPVLMKDITLNWAMGRYLDMLNNRKATATTSPNENYGRELMQLFTIGLNNLTLGGTLALDANGKPIPTFNSATVAAITAAFTGWVAASPRTTGATPNVFDPMVPNDTQHDVKAKNLPFIYPNGTTVTVALPANQSAANDLDAALKAVFAHPTLAPFVVKQLIQHLVTSNPSSAYVTRVTTVFNDTKGDMKAVVKAILIDQEARAGDLAVSANPPSFCHLREPVLLLTSMLRGLKGVVYDSSTVSGYSNAMGQNLFTAPSVGTIKSRALVMISSRVMGFSEVPRTASTRSVNNLPSFMVC